jgi:phenylacetate-CoA ligase
MGIGGQLNFVGRCYLKRWYRHGLMHRHQSRMLERTQRLSPPELKAYQDQALQRTVRHCLENVPYYIDLFRRLGLTADDVRTAADLRKLPFMDSRTVRENFDALVSRKHLNWLCQTGTSSGTTGLPSRFLRDYHAINFEHAALWRTWHQAGGDDGKRRISLRGETIVPASCTEPPFWRYNPADRELQMSSYHLSPGTAVHYIDKILSFQPQILYCGPSMGHLLAKLFAVNGVRYRFDAVFTSSETLAPEVRRFIERTFDTRIVDWYGQAERVAAIGQCAEGSYHVQEDYSIVEFEPAQRGLMEIVGTQLQNRVMPLLRYRTSDYVVPCNAGPACACGSHFRRVEQIVGRYYGYLVTPEGYHIAITAHIPVGIDNLVEAQFHQERQGEVTVKIVTNGRFTADDGQKLIASVRQHTSPHMQVKLEEVPYIPRGPNGKFINIVNRMTSGPLLTAQPEAA